MPDIQILGDSVIERGLVADALSDNGALTVRNDALASSRPPSTYYLLREQFEDGRLPRAIVFSHIPGSFDDPFTARLAGTLVEWRELPEVYQAASRKTDALFGTFARFSYLLMNRTQIRALLINGDYEFFTTPAEMSLYGPGYADRAVAEYLADPDSYAESRKETFDGLITDQERVPFSVAAETDGYFRKILELANANGVQVFWLTPPESESMSKAHQKNGYYADLADYLAPFVQSDELNILQIEPEVYEDELFADKVHPKARAAIRFSCSMRRHAPVIAGFIGSGSQRPLQNGQVGGFTGTLVRAEDVPPARAWTSRC